ncbi:MAG: DUF5385 family protein [Malacoplasma sp.]|nr:DUF5385 family protein [Malacoplasma sp.]
MNNVLNTTILRDSSSAGNNSMLWVIIIVLIVVAVVGIPMMIKKKKQKEARQMISSRHNKDEVWKSIKQYLKDANMYGVEIVDSYVAKRNPIDYINPNNSKYVKDKKRYENKIRDYFYKKEEQECNKNGIKAHFVRPPMRDLYVVCFTTRDVKTGVLNSPQAIECEVVTKRIDKKNQDRKVYINGALDYDKEMEWIAPLKDAEAAKNKKIEEQQLKQREKLQKRMEKRLQKEKEKNKKANAK